MAEPFLDPFFAVEPFPILLRECIIIIKPEENRIKVPQALRGTLLKPPEIPARTLKGERGIRGRMQSNSCRTTSYACHCTVVGVTVVLRKRVVANGVLIMFFLHRPVACTRASKQEPEPRNWHCNGQRLT